MAARPSWRGHLKLSLVSCPVKLFTGTSSAEKVTFNTLNRKTQNRLRQQMFDPESGEVIGREDQVKGFEFEKGRFVIVENEEVEALRIPSTQTIDIERFVDQSEIDVIYWDSPYFMVPDGKFAVEAFAVIREAMAREGVVGLGRVVLSSRERPIALQARGKGMLVTRLRSSEDVRKPDEIFDEIQDVEISDEMVSIAEQIIARKRGPFDPSMFTDRYQDAVQALIEAKLKGAEPVRTEVIEPGKVVNLFDALRRSLDEAGPEAARKPRAASKKAAGNTPAEEKSVKQPKRRRA